jgi:iron(III) transport system substrate-binding protein
LGLRRRNEAAKQETRLFDWAKLTGYQWTEYFSATGVEMNLLKQLTLVPLLLLTLLLGNGSGAAPINVKDVIAAAKKEGALDFYAPTQVEERGARRLNAAFNRKYGISVTFKYSPSANMDKDLASLITQVATGGATDFDAAVFPDTYHATLWLRKLQVPFDYRVLGVDPKVINFDSGTVSFANQFTLPAYNKKTLPAKDVPRTWQDLLDPKWKDGKLGVTNATPAHLAVLAMAWGEEETTKYIKALAQQNPVLGRLGETYSRLLLGELAIAVTLTNSFIFTAEKAGAPIIFADIEPVVSPAYHVGVLKGARHPMAGHLFAAFLTTPEAQKTWEEFVGHTSAFIPGTRANRYVKGKKVLYMTQSQSEMIERLTREYTKILGMK